LPGIAVLDGIPVYRLPFARVIESGRPGDILAPARLRGIELAHVVDGGRVQRYVDIGLLVRPTRAPAPAASPHVSVHGIVDGLGPIGLTSRSALPSRGPLLPVPEER